MKKFTVMSKNTSFFLILKIVIMLSCSMNDKVLFDKKNNKKAIVSFSDKNIIVKTYFVDTLYKKGLIYQINSKDLVSISRDDTPYRVDFLSHRDTFFYIKHHPNFNIIVNSKINKNLYIAEYHIRNLGYYSKVFYYDSSYNILKIVEYLGKYKYEFIGDSNLLFKVDVDRKDIRKFERKE